LERLQIKRPKGTSVKTLEEALKAAEELNYPVLLRPSYVLGGQNMIIAFCDEDIKEYLAIILIQNPDNPVLIDKYMMGTEIEVDAICDGQDILIPGIMEHIERAGVHSGDSIAVYPAWNLSGDLTERIIECTKKLALALETRGLINIQYVIYANQVYVIEVNPRSSRTIPYISKVTGVPMIDLATRAMLGETLQAMGYGTGLYRTMPYVAVKVPVFSFEKLADVDTQLGPEMKSTGEVLGIGKTMAEALYKGLVAAGYSMKKRGGVLFSVKETDHSEIAEAAKKFANLGFRLYATHGTAQAIAKAGLKVTRVCKIHEASENVLTLIESGQVDYVISTSSKGRVPTRDSVKIRRKTVERSIPCLTSIDTANALIHSLASHYSQSSTELVDINHLRQQRQKLRFIKMQGCGNDNIYFDCLKENLISPESLSIFLSDRHYGIGGEGLVQILPSEIADARMRMFNMDGSEGIMAGNAVRCVGKYLYDSGILRQREMNIETLGGVRQLKLFFQDDQVNWVRVTMGQPVFTPSKIPVLLEGDSILSRQVRIEQADYAVTCLSLGNPHCVVFCDQVDELAIEQIGPGFEQAEIFPERINTEFVTVLDPNTLKMRVWERGSGETWSCGTGACAAVVAAVLNGFCQRDKDITVLLKGGRLIIRYTADNVVYMTGEAKKLFEGVVEI
jgi:carbamoyl-phosphate synthase large subunit